MWIFSRYITKNGRRIYPKNSQFFRFWVDDDVDDASDEQLSLFDEDE